MYLQFTSFSRNEVFVLSAINLSNCIHCLFFLGDAFSSSPDSTPMGSIESLSSHSSELNNSSKTSSSQHHVQREKGDNGIPWVQTPATLPGLKNTVVWTTSPESSSSEDTVKTDGLSDSQNLVSAAGNKPPPLSLCSEGPHKHNVLKRSITTSLTSLPITDGRFIARFYLMIDIILHS